MKNRHQNTVKVFLIAVVMLMAAGTPARAETKAGRDRAQIRNQTTVKFTTSWMRFMKRFTRYAMAAN